jgi:hypothetical protein
VDPPDRCAGEGLEQSPPAGAGGESSLGQIRLDRTEDLLCQLPPWTLQVEHELCLGGGGGEQLVQTEPWAAPRRLEPPPVPEDRNRAGRFQVPDFQPAPIKVDVSLYKGRLEALRGAKIGEAIPGSMRDQERAVVVEVARAAHRARV